VQIHVDPEQIAFGALKKNQPAGLKRGNLTAQLGPDRASGAGHHHYPALNGLPDDRFVQVHGIAAQQIDNGNITDLAGKDLSGKQASHAGNSFTGHAGSAAIG
jgi:hypothetical protein